MHLTIWILIFTVSLAVLVKSADLFNKTAEEIGLFLKISPFTIGLVLLSIGTSLPELVSSIFAVLSNAGEVVAGNVVGSNIANILLVLGLAAILHKKPIEFTYSKIRTDMLFMLLSTLFLIFTLSKGKFQFWEGLIGLVFFITYMIFTKKSNQNKSATKRPKLKNTALFIFPFSIVLLYFGAKFTIDSLTIIAEALLIGKDVLAASAIAIATSLPELFVSLDAIRKGKNEMAAGNIIGSCIFNAFIVMGIPSLISDYDISLATSKIYLPVMVLASLILFILSYMNIKLNRWIGIFFIIMYAIFIFIAFYF